MSPSQPSLPDIQVATPAMRQYLEAKRQHPDALVFFRMGDFYEMFYEDALVGSRALELTLTSQSKDASGGGIPMCGVPFHAADVYVARLVAKGYRVAICEQVENPKTAKGLVRREVVRVVSPGTFTDAAYLEAREPTFMIALAPSEARGKAGKVAEPRSGVWGVAVIDVSTGEFSTAEYQGPAGLQALADELSVLKPRELLTVADFDLSSILPEPALAGRRITRGEGWTFDFESARRTLLQQLQSLGLEGFGLEGHTAAVRAAGALVHYLRDTQKVDLAHVRGVAFRETAQALLIDPTTLAHLEIVEAFGGGRAGSLLDDLDRTITVMGGRLLRAWLLKPLLALERIRDRLDAVEEFAFQTIERGKFRDVLKTVLDLERLVARAALGSAGPRDLIALRQSLAVIPRVRELLGERQAPLIVTLLARLDDLPDLRAAIATTIADDPPALARDGGAIRDGADPELDELRAISRSGRQLIADMEARERARTGIASLKIRYNRVFGYYIEISKSNLHLAPTDYIRKQTIAGGERFITPALRDYEQKILGADERILEREIEIFESLRARVAAEAPRIQESARGLAALDVLAALAETAVICDYTKPHVHDGDELSARDVRHPVVERRSRDAFVPNDVMLNASTHQLVLLTGPNMGGKSTYLRQTALLCVLAQAGSFVPAREAKTPLVDRVFARVGASDNIARGQSTFMVEMQETANILHSATSRSLVVLDEIGRGTSTFDGLSLAWAVAERLVTAPAARPKTIFATHYHELTDLADAVAGVVNLHVSAREWRETIVFLHKIVPGRSDRSYGLQVARLAGLPAPVIDRARAILEALEADALARGGRPTISGASADVGERQLGLFQTDAPHSHIIERVRAADPDRMTPLEALTLLTDLKRELDS